jgi:hypothetical protein
LLREKFPKARAASTIASCTHTHKRKEKKKGSLSTRSENGSVGGLLSSSPTIRSKATLTDLVLMEKNWHQIATNLFLGLIY